MIRGTIVALAFVVGALGFGAVPIAAADSASATPAAPLRPMAATPRALEVALDDQPLYVPGQEHIRITPPSATDVHPDVQAWVKAREFAKRGRSTRRYEIGGGVASIASFPGSIEDGPAPFMTIAKPFWLGERYRFFQWTAEAVAFGAYGTYTHSAHVDVAARFGFNLYLGSVFGFEFKMGPALAAQIGERSVGGAGFVGDGGYVFRFWKDDLRRIKLNLRMRAAFYFGKDDPANDLGVNGMGMALGLAYEQPY